MANYIDLFNIPETDPVDRAALRNKIEIAISIKVRKVLDDTLLTDYQRAWAMGVLNNPRSAMSAVYNYVIGFTQDQTPSVTVAQILAATDATIQARTDTAVDSIVAAVTANTFGLLPEA